MPETKTLLLHSKLVRGPWNGRENYPRALLLLPISFHAKRRTCFPQIPKEF